MHAAAAGVAACVRARIHYPIPPTFSARGLLYTRRGVREEATIVPGFPDSGVSGEGAPADPEDALLGATLKTLRRAAREVEVERSLAEALQHNLLAARLPEIVGLDLAARYLPGGTTGPIGGDWYDAVPLRGGRVGLVIGDVVGHGVSA